MKIGLLAYHSACNFGATLQLLSSYMYWRNAGHDPIIINWIPRDLELFYAQKTPIEQLKMQLQFRSKYWKETALCRTDREVATVIEQEQIQAVVVGSDATCQHHTIRERLVFPCRRIVYIRPATKDTLFEHNPFWGTFNAYLTKKVPVAVISTSNQDSNFHYFGKHLKQMMYEALGKYVYLSVRDNWTAQMFQAISEGNIIPPITPDPVFAFNYNAAQLQPTLQELKAKYNLPDKYILFSFIRTDIVSNAWINEFKNLAERDGIKLYSLPFAHKPSFGEAHQYIPLPLSPLEWYALIRYSYGYIGNNMHPIVVALHNAVPFFSFDNYGTAGTLLHSGDESSSKILHILKIAGLQDYRISCVNKYSSIPSPKYVLEQLAHFPKEQSKSFADSYYTLYKKMMRQVEHAICHNAK